jgi:hypothetical protein
MPLLWRWTLLSLRFLLRHQTRLGHCPHHRPLPFALALGQRLVLLPKLQ